MPDSNPGLLNRQQLRPLGFLALNFLLSLSIVTGMTLATTLFLSQAGAASLPLFFIVFALVSTPVSALLSWWLDRIPRLYLLAFFWLLLGLLSLLGWWIGITTASGAFVFYLGISLTELLLGSLAGILLSDYFSLTESKRLTGKVSLMLALGGICGALLVSLCALWLSPSDSLWLISLLSLSGLLLVHVFQTWQQPLATPALDEDETATAENTLGGLGQWLHFYRQQPLACWLSLGVILAVFLQCLQEVLAFTLYESHYSNAQSLAVFMGFAVGILHLSSLLLATLVTGQLLPRLGIARTHLFHPLFNLLAFACVAFSGRLWTGIAAHIASDPADASVNGPTTTLLYNALPGHWIGRLRLLNDGIVYPLALGLAGLLLLWLEPLLSSVQLALLGCGLSLLLLLVHWRAGQGYETNLQSQVNQGTLQLNPAGQGAALPRARGLHSYSHSLNQAVPVEEMPAATGKLPNRALMNQWLTLLRQPSTASQCLAAMQTLHASQYPAVLAYLLPRLVEHPIDSLVLFLRNLPTRLDAQSRKHLRLWYQKHWGQPLQKLMHALPLLRREAPLQRQVFLLVTGNYRKRAQYLLMELLRPFDQQQTLQGIETRLYAGNSRQQAQAVESLSLIPERRLTRWLATVFEPPRPFSLASWLHSSGWASQQLLDCLRSTPDPWMKRLAEIYSSLSTNPMSNAYFGAPLMERLELLHRIPLFAELSLDDLQSLDAQLNSRKLPADSCLFSEGDAGDCLYILVTGRLAISRNRPEGEPQQLAELEAGQPVGEMALLDELPRSATATLLEDSELLRLDKLRFHSLVMQRPQILLGMCKVLAARLRK